MGFAKWLKDSPYQEPATTADTQALYKFDGALTDSSGNGLTLSVSGTERYGWIPNGGGRRGFVFDGATDLQRATNDAALTITGDMTIDMGIVLGHHRDDRYLNFVGFRGGAETEAANDLFVWYAAPVSGNKGTHTSAYFAETGSGTDISHNATDVEIDLGVPMHLAMVRSSNNVQFYLNGQAWGAASTGLSAPSGGGDSVLIVGSNGSSAQYLHGLVWDLHIADAALTQAEIMARAKRSVGAL